MPEKKTLANQFQEADAQRGPLLKRCRDYATLTIADVLPPFGKDINTELPACWTNIGGVGTENMVSRIITSVFPVGLPWFVFGPSAELKANRDLSIDQKNAFIAMLYGRELIAASKLESTNYRLAKRAEVESLMICGNALTRMGDDYNLRYYRFDHWVCKRSGTGQLLWTITREKKHPNELSEEDKVKAKIKADDDDEHDLYTRCKWLGEKNGWQLEQEMNETILRDEHEPVSPYNCVTYRLCPGEDYASGFIATRFPDLKSDNFLWEALIFGMANAAKMIPVVDTSEVSIRSQDLCKANGTPVTGRVVGGVVQGVAFLQTNKSADFGIAFQGAQALEQRLGQAMLLETASMPKGERVTAYAVGRIAQELEGALGGPYIHIAEQSQKPLLERLVYQLERDLILIPIPDEGKKAVSVAILTGAAALSRAIELDKLISVIQLLAPIEGALDKIDQSVLVDRIFQYKGVDTTGLIKSAGQLNQKMQEKMAQTVMPEAGKQFVKTVGSLVEQRAAQQQEALQGTGNG